MRYSTRANQGTPIENIEVLKDDGITAIFMKQGKFMVFTVESFSFSKTLYFHCKGRELKSVK